MKIYTKGGDRGETGLFGGARVPKTHPRIEAYGTLDELNAVFGVVVAELAGGSSATGAKPLLGKLVRIQGELFQLGAELATPTGKKTSTALVSDREIVALENEIDAMEAELAPLKTFILPGGTPGAALLHLARTVCRRAERAIVDLYTGEGTREEVIRYMNRLSDYLFVCARWTNSKSGVADAPWVSPGK